MLRILILGMVFLPIISAAELPAGAQKAEAAYLKAVAEIMEDAHKDISKEKGKYEKALNKELKSVMKGGDLKKATAVQAIVDELEKSDPLAEEFGDLADVVEEEKEEKKSYRIKIIAAVVTAGMREKKYYVDKTIRKHVAAGNYEINPNKLLSEETGVRGFARLSLSYTINGGKNITKQIGWHNTESLIPEEKEGEE